MEKQDKQTTRKIKQLTKLYKRKLKEINNYYCGSAEILLDSAVAHLKYLQALEILKCPFPKLLDNKKLASISDTLLEYYKHISAETIIIVSENSGDVVDDEVLTIREQSLKKFWNLISENSEKWIDIEVAENEN